MEGKRMLAVLLMVALLVGLLAQSIQATGPGDPAAGTVQGIDTYTLFSQRFITNTTTLYGGSVSGEVTRFRSYNALDVFVTGDISGTRTVTVTLQVSADGTNWADAKYQYTGTPLNYATTTTTTTLSSVPTVYSRDYQVVLSADGTDYVRLPVTGMYVRPQVAFSGTVTQSQGITLTIAAVARNN